VQEGNIKPVLDFLQRKFEQRPPRETSSISPQNFLHSLQDHLDEVKKTTSTLAHADPLSQNEYKQRVYAFLQLDELEGYWGAEMVQEVPTRTPPQTTSPDAWGMLKKYRIYIGVAVVILFILMMLPAETPPTPDNASRPFVEYKGNDEFHFNDVTWQHDEYEKIKWAISLCKEDNRCKAVSVLLTKQSKQDVAVRFPNADVEHEKYAYFVIDWVVGAQVIKTDTVDFPTIEAK
jgi:hypothetical protein